MKKTMMIVAMVAVIAMAGAAMAATDADVMLWLKADAITGLAEGGTLTSWLDSSTGYNNDGTTIVGTPTWHSSVINSKPVVRFTPGDGADEVQVPDTDNSLDLSDWTILVAFQTDASATGTLLEKDNASSWNYLGYHRNTSGSENQFLGAGGQQWARAQNGSVTAPQIVAYWHDDAPSDDMRVYVDGLEPSPYLGGDLSVNPVGATPTASDLPLQIGGNTGVMPADIAEIIIFNLPLDDSAGGDLEDVTAYLGAKYGITVAGTGNAAEGLLLLQGAPVIPEPAGLGLIGLALLAVRRRRS